MRSTTLIYAESLPFSKFQILNLDISTFRNATCVPHLPVHVKVMNDYLFVIFTDHKMNEYERKYDSTFMLLKDFREPLLLGTFKAWRFF